MTILTFDTRLYTVCSGIEFTRWKIFNLNQAANEAPYKAPNLAHFVIAESPYSIHCNDKRR